MNVYERVEQAQKLKLDAGIEFKNKNYAKALELYGQAVEAVRYVQYKSDSSNYVRADLLVVMITCCNNAATCCTHLEDKWDEAMTSAKNALVLIAALERQRGKKIHSILSNEDGISDTKLFGEWRVKSFLIIARALMSKHETEDAIETLKQAHEVVEKYTADGDLELDSRPEHKRSIRNLLQNDKEVRKLHLLCKERRKAEKVKEKKRAQAMFGGLGADEKESGSIPVIEEADGEESDDQDEDYDEDVEASTSIDEVDDEEQPTPSRQVKKKVSFSDTVKENTFVPEPEETEENGPEIHRPRGVYRNANSVGNDDGTASPDDEDWNLDEEGKFLAIGIGLGLAVGYMYFFAGRQNRG